MKTIKIGTNAYYYKNEVGDGLLSYAMVAKGQGVISDKRADAGIRIAKKIVKKLNARCVKCGERILSDEDSLCGQCI